MFLLMYMLFISTILTIDQVCCIKLHGRFGSQLGVNKSMCVNSNQGNCYTSVIIKFINYNYAITDANVFFRKVP